MARGSKASPNVPRAGIAIVDGKGGVRDLLRYWKSMEPRGFDSVVEGEKLGIYERKKGKYCDKLRAPCSIMSKRSNRERDSARKIYLLKIKRPRTSVHSTRGKSREEEKERKGYSLVKSEEDTKSDEGHRTIKIWEKLYLCL